MELATVSNTSLSSYTSPDRKQFLTMEVDRQLFGIPVLTVQDVIRPLPITLTPLAPEEILGAINLRGRIVTVMDVRKRLGLPPRLPGAKTMQVVVEYRHEPYSLVVDTMGDVMALPLDDFEANPPNLSSDWQTVSLGVYRLKSQIMVVLDIKALLRF